VEALSARRIGYLHVIEGITGGPRETGHSFRLATLRPLFKGTYIGNNGYTRELALATRAENGADLIAFGKLFLANPDLVERLRRNAPLNEPDEATFYGGDAKGYTDYPFLDGRE
jgi:N-ethylmaleimide reductase